MVVFAFDRDWTVDVSPHPRKQTVPLDWVRHLAHETDHPVYAIGNQSLAEEAAIPGIVDIVGQHADPWEEWLGGKQPNGRYERFPTRRERLALITDLHPDTDEYIVVDDLDLGDVEEWTHYHAWEFVPTIRNGDIDPGLPWCEARADGGSPTTASIRNPDLDEFRTFLDTHTDAEAFSIRYTDDTGYHERLIADAAIIDRTVQRPAAAIAVECMGLPPGVGEFHVRLDNLQFVAVTTPPEDLFTVAGDTPTERAASLTALADTAPDRVSLSTVIDLLNSDDSDAREHAVDAVLTLTDARPVDCRTVLPVLRTRLAESEFQTPVLSSIAAIAAASPSDVAPFTDELTPYLQAEEPSRRKAAARSLSEVASHDPTDVVDAVPALTSLVADRDASCKYALHALNVVADEHPSEVLPAATTLADAIDDDSLDAGPRLNATAALGRIASEFPDAGLDAIKSLCDLLDADDKRLRANAAGVLGDIATVHANALVPHVDDLAVLLESDDDYALVNTTAALSRVAEMNPDAVKHLTDQYITLLDHDHRLVRLNACWMLGHVRASTAASRLDDVRLTDADEQVRNRAAWALTEVSDGE